MKRTLRQAFIWSALTCQRFLKAAIPTGLGTALQMSPASQLPILNPVRYFGFRLPDAPFDLLHSPNNSLSNQTTLLSPSKASMCVAIRSKNHLSCDITTAHPAKFSKASSKARSVFTSRSLVAHQATKNVRAFFQHLRQMNSIPFAASSMLTFFC